MNPAFDISIVVSSFNRDDKVLNTIERLFESDFSKFEKIELIIIDDGSPQPVEKLLQQLKKIPEKIELKLITQKNSGIGATRNRGFREAKADIILFLDDDILVYKDTLKKIFDAQQENIGPVIFGNYPFISHQSESLLHFAGKLFQYNKITTEKKFEKVNAITSGLLSVNKRGLNGLEDFYKDDLRIPAAEEHEIIYRFYKEGIPILQAMHISAIHNHHLELAWLVSQQYKYGMATAEAVIKYPEIMEMEKFNLLNQSLHSSANKGIKRWGKAVLSSAIGRRILFFFASAKEKLFPKANHDFVFGLLTTCYFRAGYNKGLKRFYQ